MTAGESSRSGGGASSSSWTHALARVVVHTSLLSYVFAIAFYSYDLWRHGRKKHLIGWFSSAAFVLVAVALSLRLIVLHLSHWYMPRLQKYVVRIIWLIPVYSVESWLALRFKNQALYIETLRECYEGYVIYSFLYFLVALLGEEAALIANLKEKPDERGEHSWPLRLVLKPWVLGSEFLHHCRLGVLQYCVVKYVMAAVIFLCQLCRVYDEGQFKWNRGYVYVCAVSNISQFVALYCLLKFYWATKEELQPFAPIGKVHTQIARIA